MCRFAAIALISRIYDMKLICSLQRRCLRWNIPEMNSTNSSILYIAVCYVLSDAHPTILQFPSRLAFLNHVIVCAFNVLLTVTTVITNSCIVVTFFALAAIKGKRFSISHHAVVLRRHRGWAHPQFHLCRWTCERDSRNRRLLVTSRSKQVVSRY